MAKTCRQAFEEKLYGDDDRKRRDGQYSQDFIRVRWAEFQAGWKACGGQALELYDEWAADLQGPDLRPQLEIFAKGDVGDDDDGD